MPSLGELRPLRKLFAWLLSVHEDENNTILKVNPLR